MKYNTVETILLVRHMVPLIPICIKYITTSPKKVSALVTTDFY